MERNGLRIDCIERGDKGMNTTKRLDFGVLVDQMAGVLRDQRLQIIAH